LPAAGIPAAPAAPTPALPLSPSAAPPPAAPTQLIQLNFRDSPIDQVLEFVSDLRGKTLIKSPGLPNANVTLKSVSRLTVPEALVALDAVLAMNNVSLVPLGDKFLKVVQTANARQESMPVKVTPGVAGADTDSLVSQVITLRHMEIAEAQPVVQAFLHAYGKIQPLERTNSMLVTDTESNIKRILEVLELVDQPVEAREETRIYELQYAKAADVASRLNEFLTDQTKEEKPRISVTPNPAGAQPGQPTAPPGVIRAPRSEAGGGDSATVAADAERGLLRGKVKIISDERSNIIFVISRPENFTFFDRIVAVLDRPIDPDVIVRVLPLEYAASEDVASILNEFIGAAQSERSAASGTAQQGGQQPAQSGAGSRSTELRDFIRRQAESRQPADAAARARLPLVQGGSDTGNIGQLSPETRILADERTNALLLMGRKRDLDALEDIIKSLDVMLAQVLIETVILEINLGDTLDSGVDWLQRSVTAYNEQTKGPGGGVGVRAPVMSFGGGSVEIGDANFQNAADIGVSSRNNVPLTPGGLTYYLTLNDLNLDMVIRLAASSRDARILSTPVILTTDNTEANIVVGEERPVVTSSSTYDTGTQNLNYEYRNIGINLTVTPRINPQRFVVMEIKQTADNVGGFEVINGNRVPVITKRELGAEIAVQSRNTVVLGGLVGSDTQKSRNKVPLLGDIPILGQFFRYDSKSNTRTELMVLITPYVLTTPDEALAETRRLHDSTVSAEQNVWPRGWSDSPIGKRPQDLMREEGAAYPSSARRHRSSVFPRRDIDISAPEAPAAPVRDAVPADEAAPGKDPVPAKDAAPGQPVP
jgi:general secretion pathway protein D